MALAIALAASGSLAAARATCAEVAAPRLTLVEERLEFDWKVMGFRGVLAGLFLPNRGRAVLAATPAPGASGHWTSELLLTAHGHAGEYWRYGAEVDPAAGRAVRVWSSYFYDGKRRHKEEALAPPPDGGGPAPEAVIDITSGIARIRAELPERVRPMRIWSDGRIYPVRVIPHGAERRRIQGAWVDTRHFVVEGAPEPGGRTWSGRLELWLALDGRSTPVEMIVERGWAGVRLTRTAAAQGAGGGS